MKFLLDLMRNYEAALNLFAEFIVLTLELIGILIIIIGSLRAVIQIFSKLNKKENNNIVINLGNTLALALEFKMGAEIVNTVIVRDLRELGTLAIVIALRAILSLLIHWEIKNEKNSEKIDTTEKAAAKQINNDDEEA